MWWDNYFFPRPLDVFQDGGEITVGRLGGKIVGYL